MTSRYKIHPAIGVARIGNAPDAFFVGPEAPGAPGVEIAADGSEAPVKAYKDNGRIKRQAARFRVFEYTEGPDGKLTLVGEVTPDKASIEWDVNLCNRKAALDHTPVSTNPKDPNPAAARQRNPGVPRDQLIIQDPRPHKIAGTNKGGVVFDQGQFKGQSVYLGELRTDSAGRLIVLGGRGHSESIPAGLPLPTFANNNGWHDDVSDGPVNAVVKVPGQPDRAVDAPAWVVVAPPDFVPGITAIVTLYDVAMQAAFDAKFLPIPARPSFRRHIRPVIERAFDLRWTHSWEDWISLAPNFTVLADDSATAQGARQAVFARLTNPGLTDFVLPDFLSKFLQQWRDGDFDTGANDPPPPPLSVPEQLDRGALEACVGANFFPGIEASLNLRDKDMYVEAVRLNAGKTAKVYPGCLTEIMAVPWQADFNDCSGSWWPSQRPDIAMLDPTQIPDSQAGWADPIDSHKAMVDNVQRLGFILAQSVNQQTVFLEVDRDPTFQRP